LCSVADRLLQVTVESLEQSRSLLLDDDTSHGPMTGRLADLCEELAKAVSGLLALQDRLATTDTDSLQKLDSLVQTASALLRLQQQQQTEASRRGGGGSSRRRMTKAAARSRRGDSSSAASTGKRDARYGEN
jgi:hypothetical protein